MIFNHAYLTIEQVTEKNLMSYCSLLHYRRFGVHNMVISREITEFSKNHNFLNSEHYYVFVAKYKDDYIGYVHGIIMPKFDFRLGILFIDELWVNPNYRNNQVAETLMKHIINKAQKLNLFSVRLYVSTDNMIGRSFYQKLGFQEKGDSIFCEFDISKD